MNTNKKNNKVLLCVLLFFNVTSVTQSQDLKTWIKQEVRNNWGDIEYYQYFQVVPCTDGRGSLGGHGTWFIAIGVDFSEDLILFTISTVKESEFVPVFYFANMPITVNLRENGTKTTQTFKGITIAEKNSASQLVVLIKDRRLITALRKNTTYSILIEGENDSWYVRANEVNGNLQRF